MPNIVNMTSKGIPSQSFQEEKYEMRLMSRVQDECLSSVPRPQHHGQTSPQKHSVNHLHLRINSSAWDPATMQLNRLALVALGAVSCVHAFRDTSPFFFFSTSE